MALALIDKVADAVAAHAVAQVEAGCDVIQLFDSNAGELPPPELERFALTAARRAIAAIKQTGVPVIYFARNVGAHLPALASLGADVLSLDWQVTIAAARQGLSGLAQPPALQGNLDPAVLLTTPDEIDRRVGEILDQAHGHPGFIFNLGHGVLPITPPEHARRVVEAVHQWRPQA
jgi:uroporphyrinogen decarboxylase